jgi:hypothetical protein
MPFHPEIAEFEHGVMRKIRRRIGVDQHFRSTGRIRGTEHGGLVIERRISFLFSRAASLSVLFLSRSVHLLDTALLAAGMTPELKNGAEAAWSKLCLFEVSLRRNFGRNPGY